MNARAQLEDALTDDERAALRELLTEQNGGSVAGAAAGATAVAGVGTAVANPSTTDSDGDVGLPGDRTDVFADGVDSAVVHNDRYNDGVNALGTLTLDATIELDPSNGNLVTGNIQAFSRNQIDFPTVPAGFTFHLAISGDSQSSELVFGKSVTWDGGSAPAAEIDSNTHFYRFTTYDGGSTWHGRKIGKA
jgi:Flp pilus assembly protein TadG